MTFFIKITHNMCGLMKNITLSMSEELLKTGREYAQEQGISLNTLVRTLLEREAGSKKTVSSENLWLTEVFMLMDSLGMHSRGEPWTRSDVRHG